MRASFRLPLVLAGLAALAACSKPAEKAESPPPAQAEVTREAPPATPAPAPAPAPAAAIQTQPGPGGTSVALTRVAVTGDVLTVQLAVTGPAGKHPSVGMPLGEVSVIDDSSARKLGVLKDAEGKWMASPLGAAGNTVRFMAEEAPTVVWFKFPAPPAASPTISINLPGVGPFDGVPVTR